MAICQKAFKEETDRNQELLECFSNNLTIEKPFENWKKIFDQIVSKCFKKIRITPKKSLTKLEKLLTERVELMRTGKKSKIDDITKEDVKEKIEQIENEIGEEVVQENFKVISETVKEFGGDNLNGSGRKKVWEALKKKFPKNANVMPVGKKDNKGNIITNHEQLKQLYLKTYVQRLRNRPMKDNLQVLKSMKNELFEIRLKIAQANESKPWKMIHLETVLKALKKNKSRDPSGWVNELFMDGVLGKNLKVSLLHMLNKIRESNKIPDFVRLADVSTIYKGKGPKSELVNDRGIFVVA